MQRQNHHPKDKLIGGETVQVQIQESQENLAFEPETMDLDIVFEDDTVLVLNKPAGLVVHPAAGNWTGTLLNGLLAHCPELAQVPRAGIVHRLDKDTSGLMVVAKRCLHNCIWSINCKIARSSGFIVRWQMAWCHLMAKLKR